MENLLNIKYYFAFLPGSFEFSKLTLSIALGLLVLALIIKWARRSIKDEITKKMIKHYPGTLALYGLALMVLLLFREANMPFLSMRIWWVALFVAFAYWVLKTAITFRKEYKNRLEKHASSHSYNKYLPKKKR